MIHSDTSEIIGILLESMKLPSIVIDLILGIGLTGAVVLLVFFGSEAQKFVYAMF